MEHQGHKRRSKHREVAGASGSSQAPTSHSKKLAKRQRPNLWEESSPDSFRILIPPTSDDNEFLEMRASVVHGNHEVVNYNKTDSNDIVKQHGIPCYNSSMEKGTDERF
jgi:hypothetical protein